MKGLRLRALVLAAGRGERLRPLTDFLPKPLLPVTGRPVAGHTLLRLASLGCEAAAVNLHHLGEKIRRTLGQTYAGLPLLYSEEAELLGTLGALAPLKEFFAGVDLILIVNGDTLCRWPLRRLVRRHLRSGAAATLLLARQADPEEYGGGMGMDEDGRIVSVGPGEDFAPVHRRLVFAGAHLLSPELLERVGSGPGDSIRDLYLPLLREGAHLHGVVTSRSWHDLGTPRRYLEAVLDWARGRWPVGLFRRRWISPQGVVRRGAAVRRAVVEPGATIESGVRLEETVVLNDSRIGAGSHLQRVVVGPGVEIPPGTSVERRLITLRRLDSTIHPQDSVLGNLIYTPTEPPGAAGRTPAG